MSATAQPPKIDLKFLDGLRGLTALYVLVGHARPLVWEGQRDGYEQHPQLYSAFERLLVHVLAPPQQSGRGAVMLFFVLSGFVIHLRSARQIAAEDASGGPAVRIDVRAFLGRRLKRLEPPLLASMAIAWLVNTVGDALSFPINDVCHLDAVTGLGNVAFLMPFYVPVWGTNVPLWSLGFEFWFYALYPVFFVIARRSLALATALHFACVGASLAGWIPLHIAAAVFSYMGIWWLGVVLAESFVGRRGPPLAWFMPLMVFFLTPLVYAKSDVYWDNGVGLGCTGLLASLLWTSKRGAKHRLLERFGPLGDCSYTLYVVHYPLLLLFHRWLRAGDANHALPLSQVWIFVGIAGSVAVAWALHFVTERPFVSRRA